jgi:hypothetical protein
MIRSFVVAIVFSGLAPCAWAQIPPPQAPAAAQKAAPASKPAANKPAPKAKAAAKPAMADNGACQIGVISTIGGLFTVQKIGLTVFGNEQTEVPIDGWGLDDLAVARVRVAVAGTTVRKIAYARGAFDSYYKPGQLFRDGKADLTAIVRSIAANARCGRYIVLTRLTGQLPGTNQTLHGIGVFNRSLGGLLSRNVLFANFNMMVFDGQSFEIVKSPSDSLGARLARSFSGDSGLVETETRFPEPAAEAVNNAELREGSRALLTKRLDQALAAFFKE